MPGPWEKYQKQPIPAPIAEESIATPITPPWVKYQEPASVEQVETTKQSAPWEKYSPDVDPEYTRIRQIIERPALDANLVGTEKTTDTEINAIAKHHGIDPDQLRSAAPYFGARTEKEGGEVGKYFAGSVGRALGGIPQFLYKKAQEDPKYREALDDLRELTDRKRSWAEFAAENIIPIGEAGRILGIGAEAATKAPTVAREIAKGAGTGAAYGLGGSTESHELTGAAIGAGLGGAVGAAGSSLNKLLSTKAEKELLERIPRNRDIDVEGLTQRSREKVAQSEKILEDIQLGRKDTATPEEVNTVLREQLGDEEYSRLLQKPEKDIISSDRPALETPEAYKKGLFDNILEKRARDFAEDLSGTRPKTYEEADKVIDQYLRRQGPEYTEGRYREFVDSESYNKGVEEEGARISSPESYGGKVINKISDAQFVLRWIDDVSNVGAEKALSDLNRNTNRLTYVRSTFRRNLDDIFKEAQKTGVDREITDGTKIVDAIESGRVGSLSKPEQDVARMFQTQFEQIRDFVNKGVREIDPDVPRMAIPRIENYVHHVTIDTPRMLATVERTMQEAREVASRLTGREISDLSQLKPAEFRELARDSEPFQNLVKFAEWKNSNPVKSPIDLSSKLKESLYSREGQVAIDRLARASQERIGEIPPFIRETNLYKILDRYAFDTLKTLYLRQPLDKLRLIAKKLDRIGSDVHAGYIRKLAEDTLGTRHDTVADITRGLQKEIAQKIDPLIEQYKDQPVISSALKSVRGIPDLYQFLGRQIYPNVLGWFNPRPIMQNVLSGIGRTAPELGTQYGYSTYLRGMVYALTHATELHAKAIKLGLVPEEFIRAGERALSEGIRRSAPVSKGLEAYEAAAKFGMSLFRASESINRISILGTARMMAHDIAGGSRLALRSLDKFPNFIRSQVLANSNKPEIVENIIGKYLNDVTAFNYNRSSMFELGRDLGPLLTMFTKWPTTILGEALYELRSKGLVKGTSRAAQRLLPTLMLFGGLDYVLFNLYHLDESDRAKKFLGKSGLHSAAPVSSISAFTKGDIFTPPAVDALMKGIIIPLSSGDLPKIERGVDSILYNFVPGTGAVKLLTDDMVTYITGRRPTGSTFLERTGEGLRTINKKLP